MVSEKAYSVESRLDDFIQGGYDPVAGAPTIETWHTLGSPGITNFTSDHARYRMTAEGQVEFDIVGHGTGTVTGATYTYANTLPSAYRPAMDRVYPLGYAAGVGTTNSGYIKITTAGVVNINIPDLALNRVVGCNIRMPLD